MSSRLLSCRKLSVESSNPQGVYIIDNCGLLFSRDLILESSCECLAGRAPVLYSNLQTMFSLGTTRQSSTFKSSNEGTTLG